MWQKGLIYVHKMLENNNSREKRINTMSPWISFLPDFFQRLELISWPVAAMLVVLHVPCKKNKFSICANLLKNRRFDWKVQATKLMMSADTHREAGNLVWTLDLETNTDLMFVIEQRWIQGWDLSPPCIFRPNWGPKGLKKIFWETAPLSPLSGGLDPPL